jgi:phosphate transport system permease protein
MIAIFLAALALVFLIGTIVMNAATIVYEYYVEIETEVDPSGRTLERINDPNPNVRPALNGSVREGMLGAVGGMDAVSRSEARELFRLLSTDAGLELGARVKETPELVGQTVTFDALLDDTVQMYIKGLYGELVDAGSEGTLRIEPLAEEGMVAFRFDPRALSDARQAMSRFNAGEARRARAEARRQQFAVEQTEKALAAAETEEERARIRGELESYRERMREANRKADALLTEATNPSATFELTERTPSVLVQANGGWVRVTELTQERARGRVMEPLDTTEPAAEGSWTAWLFERPEVSRNISDRQVVWLKNFEDEGRIVEKLNTRILTASDSSNAELAGIWGALVGSFWTMIVTFLLAFPIGVMASIYLEEFAPKNRFTDFIEVNINNLAAVPSIVFGLLGITVLISGVKLFGVELFDGLLKKVTEDPRSTPLAGGVVLALMSLPTIIIAGRASIKAVPPSIRDAALGLGASRLQTATHHVLPLAMPGILTGSIIAMAQALGETAPLIIIGMNSFIQEAPSSPMDKGNVLPSLIYLWNNNSERLFDGKTAAAISVLLIFLILMNALAVLLRKRFERRW